MLLTLILSDRNCICTSLSETYCTALGCSGDFDTMYSIGEQFVTSKNSTCYCGEGYNISCGWSSPVESGW